MERADEILVRNMIKTMTFYGIIIQLICLIIPGDHLRMAAGLWIGVVAGIGMLVHMRQSLNEALDLGEEGAQKHMQKTYAVRYVAVVIGFILIVYLDIANILTLLLGIMGLKLSAYLQPIMCKLFRKFQKS